MPVMSAEVQGLPVTPAPATGPYESVPPASRFADLPDGFVLHRGGMLDGGRVAYETMGRLAPQRDNVIVILPGLSADAHVASHDDDPTPGWWEHMVGPRKPIDTDVWFVVCVNSLGSCRGSSGPASLSPKTGRPYGLTFPALSLEDVADGAAHVVRSLGIERVACVVGTSMGGMVSLAFVERHPDLARAHVSISAGLHSPPFAIATRSLQREVVRNDPEWRGGAYWPHGFPLTGMRTARKLGLITYRSAEEWGHRFGRRRLPAPGSSDGFGPEFEIEAYVQANADRFVERFDPNCYLYLSRAIDWFDAEDSSTRSTRGHTLESALVLGVRSDLLFPLDLQSQVAAHLRGLGARVAFQTLDSDKGHDAFLVDCAAFGAPIARFLEHLPS
jgi:homoserine O-acetyltransferase